MTATGIPVLPGPDRCRRSCNLLRARLCDAIACMLGAPGPMLQTVDKQQELVRVHKLASFNSINIQASSAGGAATHVLVEDETPVATPTALADVTAALKGGDGYDRLLEFRCGRYLYHHGQATFLPVPAMPDDFSASLRGVAGSRNIKGGCGWAWSHRAAQLGSGCVVPHGVHGDACGTAHVSWTDAQRVESSWLLKCHAMPWAAE